MIRIPSAPCISIDALKLTTRWLRRMLIAAAVALLSGCSWLGYYGQAIGGQWQLLQAREPIEQLLQEDIDPKLRERLQLALAVLDFAENEMAMPAEGRYQAYVALPQRYVVWNVFAAGSLSVQPETWCYPIVGCAPYRGYFKERDARGFAEQLNAEGIETYVGGVAAYSTLGWFDDPILSSFIHWPEPDLVNLLLHELAHSQVWVNGDVAFNESFASFVGDQGLQLWLATQRSSDSYALWREQQSAWPRLRSLLLDLRAALAVAYAGPEAQTAKQRLYAAAQQCYQDHKAVLGQGRYDPLMDRLNNALLVSISTYNDWIPAFRQLFLEQGEDWTAFFTAVERLGDLPMAARETQLLALTEQQVNHHADHQYADEVQCEAFSDHTGD